jgi:hypothetical protein
VADELVASGVVTAPGAGGAIATLAAPAAGKYRVTVTAGVSGNAVADLNNMRLRRQGVDVVAVLAHGSSGAQASTTIDELDLNGAQNLTVEAIGAGTASIEYNAQIEALKIGAG